MILQNNDFVTQCVSYLIFPSLDYFLQSITVMTGSGEQLAAWKWNNSPQVLRMHIVSGPILRMGYS